jgi:hypothetical protein
MILQQLPVGEHIYLPPNARDPDTAIQVSSPNLLRTLPPLLVYADLVITDDPRNLETAEMLTLQQGTIPDQV